LQPVVARFIIFGAAVAYRHDFLDIIRRQLCATFNHFGSGGFMLRQRIEGPQREVGQIPHARGISTELLVNPHVAFGSVLAPTEFLLEPGKPIAMAGELFAFQSAGGQSR
jgi:hypothetical protein